MNNNSEIDALIKLIDDPDQEIYDAVSTRIITMGNGMIPRLENLWETEPNADTQARIESLLQRLYYQDLKAEVLTWADAPIQDLMAGALFLSRYEHHNADISLPMREVEKLKRAMWLELNNFLTPLEQANVVNSILYNYFGANGHLVEYSSKNDFLLHNLISTKKGNQLSLSILYADLCQRLDIPIHPISLPGQFVLAYFKVEGNKEPGRNDIQFYIDPINGGIFTNNDCDYYLKRTDTEPHQSLFEPIDNKQVVYHLIAEYSKCFTHTDLQKERDLLQLAGCLLSQSCF